MQHYEEVFPRNAPNIPMSHQAELAFPYQAPNTVHTAFSIQMQ